MCHRPKQRAFHWKVASCAELRVFPSQVTTEAGDGRATSPTDLFDTARAAAVAISTATATVWIQNRAVSFRGPPRGIPRGVVVRGVACGSSVWRMTLSASNVFGVLSMRGCRRRPWGPHRQAPLL